MNEVQKELYSFIKNHEPYSDELKEISLTCVAPIIIIRQIVRKAIYDYIKKYCSNDATDIFTHEDFAEVSNQIYDDLLKDKI